MDKSFHKCRLCLKLGDFCSIFEQDDTIKLSEMVMSFANVQIFEGDTITDRVCSSCIESLSSAYLFKLQCEKIDSLLRDDMETHSSKAFDYNTLINKDFHVHTEYGSVNGQNDQNSLKDGNDILEKSTECQSGSDETDSDIESIKCLYCDCSYNSMGGHTCNVTCTIEHHCTDSTGSDETLVAEEIEEKKDQISSGPTMHKNHLCEVSCVLCDEKYDNYNAYVTHINICTANVKLHYFVCPLCHEINTEKSFYLKHLNECHFNQKNQTGVDTVDALAPIVREEPRKNVRRQIGWSTDDIYQEIEFKSEAQNKDIIETPTSSPIKAFFAKLGNESFSRQSTPRKVSFRKLIEDGKAKTSSYLPFKRYIQNYKHKKKTADSSLVKPRNIKGNKNIKKLTSDSEYGSPSGTSEDSWRLKQNLICACDKKVFMLSEFLQDRVRIGEMLTSLGGVVAENTKMEMLATHFVSALPEDACSGMMVCALATGKWLLHANYVYDSYRNGRFLHEKLYEWVKHPKILELDNTSVEIAKAAVYWHLELTALSAKFPFEGMQIVLVMKKKYRQYYQMIFKALKAKAMTYDPRTPGSCCSADYCFVDMRVIERVKLKFFASHNIPVFPYQYILIFLLNRGNVEDEHKYLLQDCNKVQCHDTVDILNRTC